MEVRLKILLDVIKSYNINANYNSVSDYFSFCKAFQHVTV